jgi:release factor glutamine methyltransferase
MPNPLPANNTEWTIMRVLQWSVPFLKERHIDSPRLTAEALLAHALKVERIQLYLQHDKPLEAAELASFKDFLQRRLRREPVAYIIGRKGFWTLDLGVEPRVLIPRPETEGLVEAALAVLSQHEQQGARVLDLGTGSGAVVLALASEGGNHRYWACDVSKAATAVARRNAREAGLQDKVRFFAADWLSAFKPGRAVFDLIVSNPPYVASGVLAGLQPEIVRYEPKLALDGGADGLRSHRVIIESAHQYLAPGGALLLEIGSDQSEAVQRIAEEAARYEGFWCARDYSGRDRVVRMHKKKVAGA